MNEKPKFIKNVNSMEYGPSYNTKYVFSGNFVKQKDIGFFSRCSSKQRILYV